MKKVVLKEMLRNEEEIMKEAMSHIAGTYKEHYAGEKTGIQTIDVLEELDILSEFCQSNIIKYAMRYGKKDGYNEKDLFKIIHYTVLLLNHERSNRKAADEAVVEGGRYTVPNSFKQWG